MFKYLSVGVGDGKVLNIAWDGRMRGRMIVWVDDLVELIEFWTG